MKKLIFRALSLENYLRLLQRGFFISYRLGLLKRSPEYVYHYFDKKLINKGDTVIDIGANLGYYSKLFSKWVGNEGRIYSVEPIKLYNKIFSEATRRCKNITLLPYALGLEEKDITLVTSSKSGYLSTGLPHVYDPKRDGSFENQAFKFDAKMKIPAELFKSIERIDYIKCDIEGFEYTVLSNMEPIIAKHKPKVQVEVWGDNKNKILSLFENLNYIPYKLSNGKLTSDKKQIANLNGDYIFIHINDLPDSSLIWE